VLAAVQPPEIELALAVVREAERQGSDIDRQWRLRLERARYEAQLAERRYKAIDPDHRVVARTLEREWNDTLTALEQLEGEYHEVRRREKIELSADDRARILALAKDLPAVWHAETTTPAERKNLLRLVVHEVTVRPIEVPAHQVRVQVLWQTGAVSDFTLPRPGKYTAQATPQTTIELVRDLYLVQQHSDAEIAAELNRRGLTTGVSRAWDVPAVRRVRYAVGLYRPSSKSRRSPDRNADGLWSMHAVAARVGGLCAPGLPYGVCRTMRRFSGTISLSPPTFQAVVREVVAEYVRHGARKLALYSGHAEPAQLETLREAVLPLVDADPALVVLVVGPYAFLDPIRREAGLEGRDGHAASIETSMMLAIAEETVRADRIPDVADRPRISRFRVLAHPEAEFPTGVRGDTSRVSRELGRRTIEHVVAEVARLLTRIDRGEPE